jgi:hypothetical protein
MHATYHAYLINDPNNTSRRPQIVELPILQFSPAPCRFRFAAVQPVFAPGLDINLRTRPHKSLGKIVVAASLTVSMAMLDGFQHQLQCPESSY